MKAPPVYTSRILSVKRYLAGFHYCIRIHKIAINERGIEIGGYGRDGSAVARLTPSINAAAP